MPGRTTRQKPPRWHQRLSSAGTAAEELEVAYDRLRAALAHHCRRLRDRAAAEEGEREAARVAREAARALTLAAEALDAREPGKVTHGVR
jgi:hypothetical protein